MLDYYLDIKLTSFSNDNLTHLPPNNEKEYYRFGFLRQLYDYEKLGCYTVYEYNFTKSAMSSALNRYHLYVDERKYFKYMDYLIKFHSWKRGD